MKIAMLTDSFTVGGGLEYIYQVARGLRHHEFVICARGGPDSRRLDGLPNITLDDTGYGPSTVARHGVDLIHVNHLHPLVAHCLLTRSHRPLINSVHGIHLRRYDFIPGLRSRITGALRAWLERRCLSHVDMTLALTESDRAWLKERLGAKNVEVIPNGIDAESAQAALPRQRSPQNYERGVHFLTVARFDFQKGYEVLLTAIAAIQDQARAAQFRFDLVGDGKLRGVMESLSQRLGIGDLVHFLGQRNDVEAQLRQADCFILPSRWEGLPFVLLEAGRSACDVICSDAAGNRDLADYNRCAILFRNGDANDLARKLLAYRDGQGRGLGRTLQEEVKSKYTRTNMLQQLDALYRRFQR
jgi:glycosyltransferase involved in cell wall biosynthesis